MNFTPMQLSEIIDDFANQWTNGQRNHIPKEIAEMTPMEAAYVCGHLVHELGDDAHFLLHLFDLEFNS